MDYSHWKTAKHFASWMHLAPRQEQSGSKTRKARAQGMNRAGQLFRQAAISGEQQIRRWVPSIAG
ncbi:MAG: transposase [Ignavibacteria bacterium]|nr:transposase [Ignavibacteria bacterium]